MMPRQRFELMAPGAQRAFIAGDFNDWDPSSVRMRKMPRQDGLFVRILHLSAGQHEFKFVVDGDWRCCPHTPRCISPMGTINSVVEVGADQ